MAGNTGKSSFQKKLKPKIVSIPGTKPSVHNSQLLVSTGVPSFDFILGGGLPLGSIILIEEDSYNVYSRLLMKFFLSEGLLNGHLIHVSSLNEDPNKLLKDLPGTVDCGGNKVQSSDLDELKIAWRYQNKETSDERSKSHTLNFDITKKLDTNTYKDLIFTWRIPDINGSEFKKSFCKSLYWSLLSNIQSKIKEFDLVPQLSKLESNVMRIAIQSLISPLWGEEYSYNSEKEGSSKHVTTFFAILKSIIRSSFSVCFITVPSHLISDPTLITRLYGIVDFGIKLESFQGSEKETNPLFKDYHGLFHIKKLASINTMQPSQVDTNDWGFHLSRKTLSIKKLHLPPELSESASRSQEDNLDASACSSLKRRYVTATLIAMGEIYFYLTRFYIICLCCSPAYTFIDSLYENIRNAQETLKGAAASIEIGLKTLGQTATFLDNFIDSTLDENCIYSCQNKNEILVGKLNYVPTVNGCGSFGLYLDDKDLPRPEMEQCCNEHDICYGSCGADKENCDKKFKRCLYRTCEESKIGSNKLQYKLCQGGAKLLFTTTLTLGCTSYKEAQAQACICQQLRHSDDSNQKYHTEEL